MYQFTDPGHVSVMYFHHTSSYICHTVTLYWGEGAVSTIHISFRKISEQFRNEKDAQSQTA